MPYKEIEQAIALLQAATDSVRSTMKVPLSEVIEKYKDAKSGILSDHTMLDYGLTFRRLLEYYPGDPSIDDLTAQDIRKFLNTVPGSKKNVKNAYIALSALWTFSKRENYVLTHVIREVEIARPERRAVIPYSKADIERMLQATESSRHKIRDTAIIKILLDTGIRASELCGLRLEDMEGEYLRVMGKGSKERRVPVTYSAVSAMLEYLGTRQAMKRNAPVFISATGAAFNRDSLRLMISRMGERANVRNAHPHKFRHTFALNYLLNGGDPYSLQIILGHSTMDMVKRYLYLTSRDVLAVHDRASPLKKWGL